MTDLPADAITAAANALRRESEHGAVMYDPFDPDAGLRRIIEAAAPALRAQGAAAERERLDRRITALENAVHAYAPDHYLLDGGDDA